MPTYTFRCPECGRTDDLFMSIGEYHRHPPALVCCAQQMERLISVVPGPCNPLAGDRSYDGMRATDGTDISSRTKHRAYMRERNLTTIDDFTQTWKHEAAERAQRLEGVDPARRQDIAQALHKLRG